MTVLNIFNRNIRDSNLHSELKREREREREDCMREKERERERIAWQDNVDPDNMTYEVATYSLY